MIRLVTSGLLLLFLLPALARATETEPPLHPRNFELLPLNDLEKQELLRDNPELGREIALLTQRATRLRHLLARRAHPDDDGSRKIAVQIEQVQALLHPLMQRVVEATRQHGVDAALLRGLAMAPRGPQRVARYAMGLILSVEALPEGQRTLFEALLPRLEGAFLVLSAQRKRLGRSLEQSGLSKEQAADVLRSSDASIRRIEKRFWRLVDYVVPETQRAALHRRLPTAYQKQESIVEHLYALPGLTPTQGLRLRALLRRRP